MVVFRLLRLLGFSAIALFSIFGALASFEPTSSGSIHTGWLIFYLCLFLVTAFGVGFDLRGLFRAVFRSSEKGTTELPPPA